MDQKEIFGELSSEQFEIGDIVEWSRWDRIYALATSIFRGMNLPHLLAEEQ
mgnify:CR=1 FL=1